MGTYSPNLKAGSDTVDLCGHVESAAPLVAHSDMKPIRMIHSCILGRPYIYYIRILIYSQFAEPFNLFSTSLSRSSIISNAHLPIDFSTFV